MVGKLTMRYEQVGSQDATATRVGKNKTIGKRMFRDCGSTATKKVTKNVPKMRQKYEKIKHLFLP
jgi:hypothetical protein